MAKFPPPVAGLLWLLISLLAGLLPLLLWLTLLLLWYYLPFSFSFNATFITLGLLLLAPFMAGFFYCRWRPQAGNLTSGAKPALLLWAAACAAFGWLFGLPQPEKLLLTLIVSLLLGIAGAMTAGRARRQQPAASNPPAE